MGARVTDSKTKKPSPTKTTSRTRTTQKPKSGSKKRSRKRTPPAVREARAFLAAQRASIVEKQARYEQQVARLRNDLVSGQCSKDAYDKRLRDLLGSRPLKEWQAYFSALLKEIEGIEKELTEPRAALVRSEYELRKYILNTKFRKQEISLVLGQLDKRYKSKEISYTQFELLRSKFLEGKEPQEWHAYYDGLATKAEERLFALRLDSLAMQYISKRPKPEPVVAPAAVETALGVEEKLPSRIEEMVRGPSIGEGVRFPQVSQRSAAVILVVLLFVFAGLLFGPVFTGLIVSGEGTPHIEPLGVSFSEPAHHLITLEQNDLLVGLRLSGSVIGNGTFSVYLEDFYPENKSNVSRYLILDSNSLPSPPSDAGITSITGLAIDEVTATDANSSLDNLTLPIENLTLDVQLDIPENLTFNLTENVTLNVTEPVLENLTLNLTENVTLNVTEPVLENLTLNLTENVTLNVTDPVLENLTLNITENVTLNVTEPVLENLTLNLTENVTLNVTEPVLENVTDNITEPPSELEQVIQFEDFCVESCVLPKISGTIYRLVVEVENATLVLDNLTYYVSEENRPPEFLFENESILLFDDKPEALLLEPVSKESSLVDLELPVLFADPDGDGLDYIALSDDLIIEIDEPQLSVSAKPGFSGKTELVVIASDGEFAVRAVIPVDVYRQNALPLLYEEIPPIEMEVNSTYTLDLSKHFNDSNNDHLYFNATSMANFTIVFVGERMVLMPDRNFIGARSTVVSAFDGTLTALSNELLVLVVERVNLTNATVNMTLNLTLNVTENVTLNITEEIVETEVMVEGIVGKPVKWRKDITVTNLRNESQVLVVNSHVPGWAHNIKVRDEVKEQEVPADDVRLVGLGVTLRTKDAAESGEKLLGKKDKGKALGVASQFAGLSELEPEFDVTLNPKESRKYSIEYYTPAAEMNETVSRFGHTRLNIVSPFNYTNLTAVMNITPSPVKSIRLFWNLSRADYLEYFGYVTEIEQNVSLGQVVEEQNLTLNATPALNETPVLNETPILNETPALNESPVLNETPLLNESPVLNETPALNETPTVNETPVPVEILADNVSLPQQDWFRVDVTSDPRFNLTYIDADNDTLVEQLRWLIPEVGNVQFDIELIIIDVQSYPTVGGEWSVRFNTSGTANLTIRAVNGTMFAEFPEYIWVQGSNASNHTAGDLAFLQLKCNNIPIDTALWVLTTDSRVSCENSTTSFGNATIACFSAGLGHPVPGQSNLTYLNYTQLLNTTLNLSMSGVFVRDYNCNGETSFHTVRVLTPGVHQQEFLFGYSVGYANNFAFDYTSFSNEFTSHTTNIDTNLTLNFTPPTKPYVPTSPDLIGLFHLDGNYNDSSGNGFHCTAAGTPTTTDGRFGTKGMEFGDDADDLSCGTGAMIQEYTGDLTVSVWVYPLSNNSVGGRTAVCAYDYGASSSSTGWSLGNTWTGNYFRFIVYNGTHYGNADDPDFLETNLNRWTHIVGVYKAGQYVHLYADGVLIASDTTNVPQFIAYNTTHASSYPLRIGRRSDTTSARWNGTLDEVAIWNRSLSIDEIREYYHDGLYTHSTSDVGDTNRSRWKTLNWTADTGWDEDDSSIIAYFRFDEGSGSTAYDKGSNGYDGTITGATWTNQSKQGYALYFDGTNDRVRYGGDLGNPSAMSLAIWFKSSNLNNGNDYIMDGRRATGTWWLLQDYASGACTDSAGNICYDARVEVPSSLIYEDRWHHVVVTDSATAAKIYLDGELIDVGTGEDPNIGVNLTIGAGSTNAGSWDGELDEVLVTSDVLTHGEVRELYAKGRTGLFMQTRSGLADPPDGDWTGPEPIPAPHATNDGVVFHASFDGDYEGADREVPQTKVLLHAGTADSGPNPYDYRNISKSQYVLDGSADYKLVYSIYFPPWSENFQAGIDIQDFSGTYLRNQGNTDQNGVNCAPWTDLHAYANGTWYTRICPLTGLEDMMMGFITGLHPSSTDSGTTYAYFADIHILDASNNEVVTAFDQDTAANGDFAVWAGITSTFTTFFLGPTTLDVPYPDNPKAGRFDSGEKRDIENPDAADMSATAGPVQSVLRYASGHSNNERAIMVLRLDETSGTTVTDENGNEGIVSGSPTMTNWGRYDSGIRFDGVNDYINMGDIDDLDTPSAFTIELWFYRDTDMDNETNHGVENVLVAQCSVSDNDNLEIGTDGSSIDLYLDTADYGGKKSYDIGIADTTWYHLAVTYDTGELNELRVYLNGVLKVENDTWGGPFDPSKASNLTFGISRPDASRPWGLYGGALDEIAIYDYAKTADEIYQDYLENFDRSADSGTISMWVKPEWSLDDTERHVLFTIANSSYFKKPQKVWLQHLDDAIFLQVSNVTHYFSCGTNSSNAAGYKWAAGEWFHIAAGWTRGSGACNFSINGKFYGDYSENVGTKVSSGLVGSYFYIGSTEGKDVHANATIDEVTIYNYHETDASVFYPTGHVTSGQVINAANDTEFVQWRAIFTSGDDHATPKLVNVTLEYLHNDSAQCDSGTDCESNLCVAGYCRETGTCDVYDGYGCSEDSNAWNGASGGKCVADGSCNTSNPIAMHCTGDGCDLGTDNAYGDCDGRGGDSCDYTAGNGNFAQDGLCFDDLEGALLGTNHDCNAVSGSFVYYNGTSYRNESQQVAGDYDSATDSDGMSCDPTFTDDYSADGMVTTDGSKAVCTDSGTVRIDATDSDYFKATCDASADQCDLSIDDSSLESPYVQDGLCVDGNTCDGSDVALDGGSYYGDCDGHGGKQCDSVATSGDYTQDGVCFDDGGESDGTNFDCETADYVYYNASHYRDDTQVGTWDYDYDENSDGVSCDDTGDWSGGHDYTADGMVTKSACTAATSTVRVDQSDNNYFVDTCDASGDLCDDSVTAHATVLWGQEGLCAANACDAQDVVNNSGTFLADCNDGGGMECEADASSGEFAQSGMCFDDGGNSDGTNFDCEVAGIIIFNATRYIDDTQNNSDTYDYDSDNDGRSCDATITSGGNYSATGLMTTNGCTAATGLVSVNGSNNNYFVVGCTGNGGDMCDTATVTDLDSPFTQDGLCLADKSCDGSDVVNNTNIYYGNCNDQGGVQCESAPTSGTWSQDGMCFDDGGVSDGTNFDCLTSGYIFYNGTHYEDDGAVAAADYDYDEDNDGDSCDLSLTSDGNYSVSGMVTSAGCTASGSLVSVNLSNGNVFVVGCEPGFPCNSSVAVDMTAPWGREGTCNASLLCQDSGVMVDTDQDGTFETSDCNQTWNGSLCDTDNDDTADGVCVSTTCDTTIPTELKCDTDGCDNTDMGAPSALTCGASTGFACDNSFGAFTDNFFTQDGTCSADGCDTSGHVCYDDSELQCKRHVYL